VLGDGNSDGENIGDRKGARVLCVAWSEGTSSSKLRSGLNKGLWKLAMISARRLLLRVEGAMINWQTLAVGSKMIRLQLSDQCSALNKIKLVGLSAIEVRLQWKTAAESAWCAIRVYTTHRSPSTT
jgi:hypothetical protein